MTNNTLERPFIHNVFFLQKYLTSFFIPQCSEILQQHILMWVFVLFVLLAFHSFSTGKHSYIVSLSVSFQLFPPFSISGNPIVRQRNSSINPLIFSSFLFRHPLYCVTLFPRISLHLLFSNHTDIFILALTVFHFPEFFIVFVPSKFLLWFLCPSAFQVGGLPTQLCIIVQALTVQNFVSFENNEFY